MTSTEKIFFEPVTKKAKIDNFFAKKLHDPEWTGPGSRARPRPEIIEIDKIIRSVQADSSLELVENMTGEKMTEKTAGKIADKMHEITKDAIGNSEQQIEKEPLTKREHRMMQSLKTAIATGVIPTKSHLGNKIRTENGTSMKKMTNADAAKFRMKWAVDQIEKMEQTKTIMTKWSKIDTSTWIYRPFGRLVVDFGGWEDPNAIKGATTGAMQCMTMGDPFIKIHPQTKMLLFAIVEVSWKEQFEQSWSETMNYFENKVSGAAGPSTSCEELRTEAEIKAATEIDTEPATPPPMILTPKAKKGSKPIAVADAAADGAIEDNDPKKKLIRTVKEGTRLKTMLTVSMSRAQSILTEIERGGKYTWARGNDHGDRRIQAAQDKVRSRLSDFQREFLVTADFPTMKKRYSVERITAELISFIDMTKDIEDLGKTIDGFVKASDAMDVDTQ